MAYEYGMASLLLSKNLDSFRKMFNRYHQQNENLPRHYEEALLLLRALRKQALAIPGHTVSRKIKLQLQEFLQALRQGAKGKTSARRGRKEALKDKYGHTYFYYYYLAG